jgi:hypothetical protein
MIPKAEYDKLYSAYGTLSNETGELRQFFGDITPLLEKADKSPELVQAFLNDKFDPDLATAILEGRVSVSDAQAVQAAAATVETKIGKQAFNAATPEEIAKMVEKEVAKVKEQFEQRDELRSFEQRTADFIASTPDFADHGDAISKWLDDHADITDVETAYFAVKGKLTVSEAAKISEQRQSEIAKEMAQNAGGGSSAATHIRRGSNVVDQLIAGRSNPNVF